MNLLPHASRDFLPKSIKREDRCHVQKPSWKAWHYELLCEIDLFAMALIQLSLVEKIRKWYRRRYALRTEKKKLSKSERTFQQTWSVCQCTGVCSNPNKLLIINNNYLNSSKNLDQKSSKNAPQCFQKQWRNEIFTQISILLLSLLDKDQSATDNDP